MYLEPGLALVGAGVPVEMVGLGLGVQVLYVPLPLLQPGGEPGLAEPGPQLQDGAGQPAVGGEGEATLGLGVQGQEVEAHAGQEGGGLGPAGRLPVLQVLQHKGEDGGLSGHGAEGEHGGVPEDEQLAAEHQQHLVGGQVQQLLPPVAGAAELTEVPGRGKR